MTTNPSHVDQDSSSAWWPLALGAFWAVVAPTLIALHDPPSITFYNQILAVCGWGIWIAVMHWTAPAHSPLGAVVPGQVPGVAHAAVALASVLVINGAMAMWSSLAGHLPGGMALMGAGLCGAALLAVWSGWQSGRQAQGATVFDLFAAALCLAGVLGMVLGLIQAFHPQWADGTFIAEPTVAGRAVGNLRQPNHFSTLLVWSCAGAVWLGARKRLPVAWAVALMALFIWGVVLTASRTGMVAMLFLTAWGVLDRQMPRALRVALISAPVLYGVFWGGMWWLSHADKNVTFAAEARLHSNSDISSSRFKIWANVLSLIASHPWAGVGFGEFNVAWTLTPFPTRPVAFFDHTHNLLLQWAVELGLPLAAVLMGLTLWAWFVLVRPRNQAGLMPSGACAVIVTTALLHSLLEYPLWYSYFLLPTAFAWGAGLAARATAWASDTHGAAAMAQALPDTRRMHRRLAIGGVVTALGAVWCAADFQTAANIYSPRPWAGPLDERIEFGQRMVWFGYQADYADVTVPNDDEPPKPPAAFRRTLHNLVDARLMIAYARSLHAAGQTDKARYVVARLKEFHNTLATPFLSVCDDPKQAAQAFQCQAPRQAYTWHELLP